MSILLPDSLPSTVDETLSSCPQFRILVVGRSGVGKSSLVSSVFNANIKDIDIADGRRGKSDITREFTSPANPRFILHDSEGTEPGSTETWEVVENFIRKKCNEPLVEQRLHAIWLCIETPRTGSRLLQSSDERLLSLAADLIIPVIIVFTKFDLLYNEYHRKVLKRLRHVPSNTGTLSSEAEREAQIHLQDLMNTLHFHADINYISVSMRLRCIETLKNLTQTTRHCLHEVEGELWIPWAAAQQISAQQKVNLSIDEGFKKYWVDLSQSAAFKEHVLFDCLRRIHLDMIKVWNFYDPESLLPETWFCTEMIKLIEPLFDRRQAGPDVGGTLADLGNLSTIASAVAAGPVAALLSAAGVTVAVINFLCQKYQAIPRSALCLGAYIVDLILILHNIFMETLVKEPPRPLNKELIQDTLSQYKDTQLRNVHQVICSITIGKNSLDPREKIADLIRQQLKMDRT